MTKPRGAQTGAQSRMPSKQSRYTPFRPTYRNSKQFNQRRNARTVKDKTYSNQRPVQEEVLAQLNVILDFDFDSDDDDDDATSDNESDSGNNAASDLDIDDEPPDEANPFFYLLNERLDNPEAIAAAHDLPAADLRRIGRRMTSEWIRYENYRGVRPLHDLLHFDCTYVDAECDCEGDCDCVSANVLRDNGFSRWMEYQETMRLCILIASKAREAVQSKVRALRQGDPRPFLREVCYDDLVEEELGRAFCIQADFDIGYEFCRANGFQGSAWTRLRSSGLVGKHLREAEWPLKCLHASVMMLRERRWEREGVPSAESLGL